MLVSDTNRALHRRFGGDRARHPGARHDGRAISCSRSTGCRSRSIRRPRFATLDALMTPANLITEIPEPVTFRSGVVHVTLQRRLAGTAGASRRATARCSRSGSGCAPTRRPAARIGTPASGTFAPLFTTYVQGDRRGRFACSRRRSVDRRHRTSRSPRHHAPPPTSLLAVGGIPVSRSFIRFALPPFLRDSATIIRATLHLQADAPVDRHSGRHGPARGDHACWRISAPSPRCVGGIGADCRCCPARPSADLEVGRWCSSGRERRPHAGDHPAGAGAGRWHVLVPALPLDAIRVRGADAADHLPAAVRLRGLLVMRRRSSRCTQVARASLWPRPARGRSRRNSAFAALAFRVASSRRARLALGGANGLFDGESSLNPAALGTLTTSTALFTSSGDWRSSTNPARHDVDARHAVPADSRRRADSGHRRLRSASAIRSTPIATSPSSAMASASPRGVDRRCTTRSRRVAASTTCESAARGASNRRSRLVRALHFLTGSNRLSSRRFWEDTTYSHRQETAELSYTGIGVSVGVIWQPVHGMSAGRRVPARRPVTVDRDSTGIGRCCFRRRPSATCRCRRRSAARIRLTPSRRARRDGRR